MGEMEVDDEFRTLGYFETGSFLGFRCGRFHGEQAGDVGRMLKMWK
jgi:hypothetical protein